MNKKLVIIVAALGLVSFAGAFATGWFTSPKAASGATSDGGGVASAAPGSDSRGAEADPAIQVPPPALTATLTMPTGQAPAARTLTEEQLKDLIIEVRDKIQQYDQKLRELEKEKERLQIAQQTLKKDIETLNNLRVDLAAGVADIKNERDLLAKARVAIATSEKANLVAIAAAYDKMDPAGASQILVNMATGLAKNGTAATNIDDAVKILFFMQDRTKAKVLAELVAQEPALAALLCQKLKQVQEGK